MKPILINLDLKTNSYEDIELKQGCQDTLIATITDLGDVVDLTGQVISVELLKADDTFIIQSTDINVSNNKVTVILNKDLTRVSGKGKLQIKMTKNNIVSGSWVVDVRIKKGAIDNAVGESGNIVTIKEELDKSIADAKIENDKTQDLIQNGGAATKGQVAELSSQLAENVQEVNQVKNDYAKKTEVAELTKDKASQTQVNQIETRLGNIIAHNGDGTKDTELIDARGTELTVGLRLNPIDRNGYVDLGGNQGGHVNKSYPNPVYLNSEGFKGWGAILNVDLTEIYSIAFKKNTGNVSSNLTIDFGYILKVDNILPSKCVILESITVTSTEWNGLANNSLLKKKLVTPIQTESTKNYFARISTPSGANAQVMQIGYNSTVTADDISKYPYFKGGLFSVDLSSWGNGVSTYSTYIEMYDRDYVVGNKYIKVIPEQVPELKAIVDKNTKDISDLKNNTQPTSSMNFYYPSKFKDIPNFYANYIGIEKDMYIIATGDSIGAMMFSDVINPKGQTEVPPVCDKMAFSGQFWNLLKSGNPIYRRFDYGKKSLLGAYSDKWSDDTQAFFNENGVFTTYYGGGNDNKLFANGYYGNALTTLNPTSATTCPINKFCDADVQVNIPKRCANASGANITFTIPAGYKKFDFLYNKNIQGDNNVTISIQQGNGKVKVENDKRDFTLNKEANGYVIDMSHPHTSAENGYDDGEHCRRIMFEKTNINDVITVTITKSTDTSKYMIYWGITYWGTATNPNAIHLVNVHRGGLSFSGMHGKRFSYYKDRQCDLILLEMTLINDTYGVNDLTGLNSVLANATTLIDYLKTNNSQNILSWLPNMHIDKYDDFHKYCWAKSKSMLIQKNIPFMDMQDYIEKKYNYLYPTKTVSFNDYFKSLMWDNLCHPGDKGWDLFKETMIPNFENII